jgi:hypothetical protein
VSALYLITVDPGIKTGVAAWSITSEHGWTLERATLVQGESSPEPNSEALDAIAVEVRDWAQDFRKDGLTRAVIEFPKLYPKDRTSPKDLNDFLLVAALAGAIRAHLGMPSVFIEPAAWKGQIPKPKKASDPYIVEARARVRMRPCELARVPKYANSIKHNLWDAIGIGCHETGRPIKEPIRVFPR